MNYHQKQLEVKTELQHRKELAGIVSDRFKGVSSINIDLTYFHRTMFTDGDIVLMRRTIYVLPEDYAYFDMQCMTKDCNGSFDLGPAIKQLVKNRKRNGKGTLACSGKGSGLPSGHATVQYDVAIVYGRKPS